MSKPFEKVAVVGSGLLGTQIAMLSAHAGYKVTAFDTRKSAFGETYDKLFADLKANGRKQRQAGTMHQHPFLSAAPGNEHG